MRQKTADKELEILNSIHIGICILEMKDASHLSTVFMNRRMLQMLELGSPESGDDPLVLDYMEDPFSCVHPADFEKVTAAFREGYDKTYFTMDNYRLRLAGGGYLWIKENVSLYTAKDGVRRFCATYRDVSEENRLQYELTERLGLEQQLRAQADNANKMKSSFLSNVSHDMRTPLNAVLGYTSLALDTNDPAQRQEYLEKISKASAILKQLINDTLDLSRIESGKMTLKPEALRLDDVLQKIIMTVRPDMDDKQIRFVLDEDDSAKVMVFSDAMRLQEILLNILSNAVKFTPEGGIIRLTVQALDKTDSNLCERFTIQDSGIGMTAEFLQRLYEPFAQERNSRTAGIEGSGLGLTIVKRIIDMMHGTIRVHSEPGKGTTFEIELTLPRASENSGVMVQKAGSRVPLNGLSILIFEDNSFNAEIARTMLEQQGAHVELAGNGREGIDLFAASPLHHFDAILMDIRMPVMDGYEAARSIRAMNRADAGTIPIIAMSADAYAEDIRRSLAAGMNEHLAKPIELESLSAVLAKYAAQPQKETEPAEKR